MRLRPRRASRATVALLTAAALAAACGGSEPEAGRPGPSYPPTANLDFEGGADGSGAPSGWDLTGGGESFRLAADAEVKRSGTASGRLSGAGSPSAGTSSMKTCIDPSRYEGRRTALRAFVRTADVTGRAFVYLRLDGAPEAFLVNTQDRPATGTTDWTVHEVSGTVPSGGYALCIGAFLEGDGTVWLDDLSLRAA